MEKSKRVIKLENDSKGLVSRNTRSSHRGNDSKETITQKSHPRACKTNVIEKINDSLFQIPKKRKKVDENSNFFDNVNFETGSSPVFLKEGTILALHEPKEELKDAPYNLRTRSNILLDEEQGLTNPTQNNGVKITSKVSTTPINKNHSRKNEVDDSNIKHSSEPDEYMDEQKNSSNLRENDENTNNFFTETEKTTNTDFTKETLLDSQQEEPKKPDTLNTQIGKEEILVNYKDFDAFDDQNPFKSSCFIMEQEEDLKFNIPYYIDCKCGSNDQSSDMVQCEHCLCWSHKDCLIPNHNTFEYKIFVCSGCLDLNFARPSYKLMLNIWCFLKYGHFGNNDINQVFKFNKKKKKKNVENLNFLRDVKELKEELESDSNHILSKSCKQKFIILKKRYNEMKNNTKKM